MRAGPYDLGVGSLRGVRPRLCHDATALVAGQELDLLPGRTL